MRSQLELFAERAREVLRGTADLPPPLSHVQLALSRELGARVLWIEVAPWRHPNGPAKYRVHVVVDRLGEKPVNLGLTDGSRDVVCRAIADDQGVSVAATSSRAWAEIRRAARNPALMHVVLINFRDFERLKVVAQISPDEAARFASQLGLGDELWLVQIGISSPTVFLHTDAAVAAAEQSGEADTWRETWQEKFHDVVRQHDEFGVLGPNDVTVRIDSRENFEQNYSGFWPTYYQ